MSGFPLWYAPGTHGVFGAPSGGVLRSPLPSGWDAATIGGILLNGKALVVGAPAMQEKIDPRKKKGANASHPTLHGIDAFEISLRVCVWTREQMDDIDDAAAVLCPPVNTTPVPLDHPQLRTIIRLLGGAFNVIVKGITPWTPSSIVHGGWEVTFPLLYWPPAAKDKGRKSKTPTYSDPNLRAAADKKRAAAGTAGNPLPTAAKGYAAPPTGAR
jgi:hypothetical protein